MNFFIKNLFIQTVNIELLNQSEEIKKIIFKLYFSFYSFSIVLNFMLIWLFD